MMLEVRDLEKTRPDVDTREPAVLAARARVQLEAGLFWRALKNLDEAIDQAPMSGALFHQRGETYARIGQAKAALADFTTALERGGVRPAETVNCRGEVYYRCDRFTEAGADFNVAVALDFTYFKPYLNRALLHSAMGRYEDAEFEVARARSLAPAQPLCHRVQGQVQVRAGKFEQAIGGFTQALRLRLDADVLHERAVARLRAGDPAGAWIDLALCLRTDPDHGEAADDRARLLAMFAECPDEAARGLRELRHRFGNHPEPKVRRLAAEAHEHLMRTTGRRKRSL
ncbi:tetratricopeptide repeat protein [Streptosporangium sp. OZ121]|uniref:tetratricopeptide repeat protein n=1 Tax=Streptosporangium sp. OZ121 TaxID=3444183 RepID=UPI003F7ABE4A